MDEALTIDQLLRHAVADGVAPGAAFAVSRGDAPPRVWTAGRLSPDGAAPPVTARTCFDLASLTKPLTTTLWFLRLLESGRLSLESRLGEHLELADARLAGAPVWRLLSHTTGLPAHREYFRGLGPYTLRTGDFAAARASVRRMIRGQGLEAPPGACERYSDLGYLLLESICEAVDTSLNHAWHDLPGHGARGLHFRPLPTKPLPGFYAATERCPWRARLLTGEVHDDNCWTLGGVAGHAGLFGTVLAVAELAAAFLATWHDRDAGLGLSGELLRAVTDRRWIHPRGARVLGWDTPTPGASTSGQHFGRDSIGHLGFTGTSVWIDLRAQIIMVLLTNRVCPTRDNPRIRTFRPLIHDAGWRYAHRPEA